VAFKSYYMRYRYAAMRSTNQVNPDQWVAPGIINLICRYCTRAICAIEYIISSPNDTEICYYIRGTDAMQRTVMLTPGTLIHQRYRITRPIGQGGMGAVYAATNERLGSTVALKQLVGGGADITPAFEQEARTLAALHHAALPRVTDYFSDPAGAFLVIEFIPGPDLHEQLAQQRQPCAVAQVPAWTNQPVACRAGLPALPAGHSS
jgi:hypothetical protein